MKLIKEAGNLKANGHYALATIDENRIYISGQLSFDSQTGEKKFGTMVEETKQILNNIDLILNQAGSGRSDVLKVGIFITDLDQWANVDKVYAEFFGAHTPARSIIAVDKLHYGFKVEIEAIASCR